VRLQWNITPNDGFAVTSPSKKNIFFIISNVAYEIQGGNYTGRWNFTGNSTTGNIDFVLKNITRADAGTYSTDINNDIIDHGVTLAVYSK